MEKQFEEIIYSRYQTRIRDMKILKVDEGFEQILGYSAEDVEHLQLHVKDIMLDEDWEDYTKIIYAKMASRGEAYLGHRLKKKNGEIIYVFCFGRAFQSEEREMWGEILITDITNTKKLSKQLENLTDINSELNMELADKNRMLESILNNLAGGVGVFDIGNKKITVEYISESFYKMFDLKKGQLGTEGNEYINLAFEEDRKELKRQIKETLLSNKMTIGEYRFINKNNPESYYWVQVCLSLLAARKSVFSICAVCVDITDKNKE